MKFFNLNALPPLAMVVKFDVLLEALVTTLIFVFIGIVFFAVAYGILSKIYPLRKEIEEDQNIALGIVIGSIMIGIAIIVAAAIQG
jgi:putative membrane protein